MNKISQLVARIFLGQIFVISGFLKISGYEGTQGYMEAMGVPGMLLPLVIALEVVGGFAIVTGWQTKRVSMVLAAFTLAAAMIFHSDFSDQIQMIMFMKNMAITGGFMLLMAYGAGAYSIDGYRIRS
ncbi:putative oxidoreductase [Nitrosomonas ureae]|uniref:Putative oxidoreductase n=1 Tax=Nitrosomonas ureae TaxID=44577 RepID=A0A285BVK8_9PROT|nr:DoxX family protein [Nitrosomonas ureae]SNX59331.1 putative oxidoreductase [Nitrosomonas ureae]